MTEKICPVCETGRHAAWSLGRKYCEAHDVCISCGTKRKDLTDTPWGVRIGSFLCKPCDAKEKAERIAARIAEGFEHEHEDKVVCPHCGYEHGYSMDMNDGQYDCPECDKPFNLECDFSVTYSTTKI